MLHSVISADVSRDVSLLVSNFVIPTGRCPLVFPASLNLWTLCTRDFHITAEFFGILQYSIHAWAAPTHSPTTSPTPATTTSPTRARRRHPRLLPDVGANAYAEVDSTSAPTVQVMAVSISQIRRRRLNRWSSQRSHHRLIPGMSLGDCRGLLDPSLTLISEHLGDCLGDSVYQVIDCDRGRGSLCQDSVA